MPKALEKPATRRHILINDDDWEWLVQQYGRGDGGLGVSTAVRTIIQRAVAIGRNQVQAQIDAGGHARPKSAKDMDL